MPSDTQSRPTSPMDASPMDGIGYYDTGKVISTGVVPSPVKQICPADPSRYYLFISHTSTSVGAIVGPDSWGGAFTGILLPTAAPFIMMNYRDHGPIVCGSWSGISAGAGSTVVTISQTIREWPTGGIKPAAQVLGELMSIQRQQQQLPFSSAAPRPGGWNPLAYWRQIMARIMGGK